MASYTDPFMRMIELMAKALGIALNKLISLKQEGKINEAIEATHHYLQTELNTTINKLSKIENEELIAFLKTKKIHQQHLENFAKLLTEYAEISHSENEKQKLYQQANYLLNYINEQDKTFSVERQNFINRINFILKSE